MAVLLEGATYEKRWREKLDCKLSLEIALRRLFRNLYNREIDFVFDVLGNKALLDVVTTYGDIDYPSLIIKTLLQRPKEWWQLFKGLNVKLTTPETH